MLVCAPKFDNATSYSYEWSRELVDLLKKHGFVVKDISGGIVKREDVENSLVDVSLYVHYDHGSEDCHWGGAHEKVIDLGNVNLLSGKEVYCMNCSSAKKLGVEAWKRGAVAYWGYVEEFVFTTDALDAFKEFANYGLKKRLEGLSWKECLEKTKERAKEIINELIRNGKYIAASALLHNMENLVCYTPSEPPKSRSVFRRLALRLFGAKGWFIDNLDVTLSTFVALGVLMMQMGYKQVEDGNIGVGVILTCVGLGAIIVGLLLFKLGAIERYMYGLVSKANA